MNLGHHVISARWGNGWKKGGGRFLEVGEGTGFRGDGPAPALQTCQRVLQCAAAQAGGTHCSAPWP